MIRAMRSIVALSLIGLSVSGTAVAQGFHPGDAVRVNDETISNQRFNGFYVEYRNAQGVAVGARGDQLGLLTRLREEAMEKLIEQELVRQAAERAGITIEPAEIDAAVAELRAVFDSDQKFQMRLTDEGYADEADYRRHVGRMLAAKHYLDNLRGAQAAVDDAALEAYYRDNTHRLTLPEQVRVRHILLTWKPMGTQDDRAAIREQMAPILERARAGEDFAALAREFTDDAATRGTGGDTGWFRRGQMVSAFEAVAFGLQPGQISDPVETAYGVHILYGEGHREARLLPLDEIREQLREHIRTERAEQAVEAEMARLREAADIQILIPLSRERTAKEG